MELRGRTSPLMDGDGVEVNVRVNAIDFFILRFSRLQTQIVYDR